MHIVGFEGAAFEQLALDAAIPLFRVWGPVGSAIASDDRQCIPNVAAIALRAHRLRNRLEFILNVDEMLPCLAERLGADRGNGNSAIARKYRTVRQRQ